jgi:hypothetical protein
MQLVINGHTYDKRDLIPFKNVLKSNIVGKYGIEEVKDNITLHFFDTMYLVVKDWLQKEEYNKGIIVAQKFIVDDEIFKPKEGVLYIPVIYNKDYDFVIVTYYDLNLKKQIPKIIDYDTTWLLRGELGSKPIELITEGKK